ncbi:MAG TPA: hypothetical protein VD887_07940 [Allosphingosinicella sp.]|nr:hypothetical protein [Allosphingosinicella sp.]
MRRCFAFLAASLCAASAAAEPVPRTDPGWVAYGWGLQPSCAAWTRERGRARRTEAGREIEMWVLGFLSGYSRYAPGSGGAIGEGSSSASLTAWIDAYCRGHPREPVARAAIRLIETLEPRSRP